MIVRYKKSLCRISDKSGLILTAGILIVVFTGCSSYDFDYFKNKKEDKKTASAPSTRSKYSIIAQSGKGVKVIDRGIAEQDEIINNTPVGEKHEFFSKVPTEKIATMTAAKEKDVDSLYKKLFQGKFEDSEAINVSINFDAASLGDVIPSFALPLKLNYILDPAVTGTITMSVKGKLKTEEVWALFEQILRMAGAYCEMENQVIHIRPIGKMAHEKKIFQKDSNIAVHLMPLKFVSAKDIVAQLKPFLSDAALAISLDKQNAIMLVENAINMERLILLVTQLDRKLKEGWHRAVFICRNIPASNLKQELLEVLPVLGFPVAEGKKENNSGEISIASLDRVQAIVVSAVTAEPLMEIRKWVQALDKSDIGEQERVYLYEVINGKADELLNALSVVFPTESTTMSANESGSSSANVVNNATTNKNTAKNATGNSSSPNRSDNSSLKNQPVASNSVFDTPIKVFADAVHNRLLVRTTPRTYSMVRAILDRMDTIPAQILMQVLVVEIELSDSNEFGMEVSGSGNAGGMNSIFGTNFEALSPSTEGAKQTGGTIHIYNPKNPDQKFGYIRALASQNNLKVLSSPQIIAKSHSKAKISVGKRVPVITNEITDTQSSIDPNNTSLRRAYQYEDTGIILTVTPQVTKGGMISMEIEQTISDAIENTMRGIESPIIKEDVLETTLALRDGRTIIMGGLIKEKRNEVVSSLPWLIDIPFLRLLSSNVAKTTERTEILVLITATIIDEKSDLENMIRRYNQAVQEIDNFENRQYKKDEKKKKVVPADLDHFLADTTKRPVI